jgi:hypothetical protein
MFSLASLLQDPWLKDHQTLVAAFAALAGSIVAFTGLLTGYLLNAALNRRQQDRIRHQEATALAAILAAEIHNLGQQAKMLFGMFEYVLIKIKSAPKEEIKPLNKKSGPRFSVSHSGPHQFPRSSEKLGLLGPLLAFNVTHFYFLYFDVFNGLDAESSKQHDMNSEAFITLVEGFQRGLQIVSKDAGELVPDLLEFAHSKNPPSYGGKWITKLRDGQDKFSMPPDFDVNAWKKLSIAPNTSGIPEA